MTEVIIIPRKSAYFPICFTDSTSTESIYSVFAYRVKC